MSITNVRHAFQGVPEILDPYHLGSFASEPLMPPEIYDKMNAKERKEGNLVIIETRENVKGEDMNSKEKITAGNHISKKPGATTKREVTAAVIPDTNDSEVKIKEEKLNTQDTSSDYNTVIRGKAKVVLETPVETTKKEDTIDDSSNSTSTIPHAKDVTNGTSSSTNFTLPRLLSTIPNDNNTAITLVAMGGLVETYMAERCIRSIRQRGFFFGPIMLFTDSDGYKQYQETIPFMDNRTTIINSREEDLYPREETKEGQGKNQTPPLKKYAQRSMVFKRFKTHHSKYIEADPNLKDSIRFVMYVDVDNIIGSPMEIFFQEYAKMVADKYPVAVDFHRNFTLTGGNNTEQLTPKTDNSTQNDFGFMSMFRDRHLKGKMHGGLLLYDRLFETQCVNAWRNEMDTYWDSSDQIMFLRVLADYDRYRCTVFDLPRDRMNFANKRIMRDSMEERQGLRPKRYKPLQFPTFIHVTKYRVKQLNNATIHNEFVRHLLHLKGNESMTDTISWEDVVSPSASRNKTR
eukprot:CAMPEP_0116139872 /NCGR_PEP_ID=MMETSP0329-20121206/13540_1 /TAXON_ID=697910 /ORGANISM="Pseudo-nitzschia arenysensis, Strain B593" /LENGTH=517 /DNA_ID=CAMNT_0003634937 /DNA_START=203 /DNA_END=1756 /DNA_ORIENTATION=+